MTVNSERDTLLYFLEAQRVAVLGIIEGLDEHQLQRQIVPSGWTPIGLIGHLAGAEWYWFQQVLAGGSPISGLPEDPAENAGWHEITQYYRQQADVFNRYLAVTPLDTPPAGDVMPDMVHEITDARAVILHIIEETARHAGHLDIARELIDGKTGLGPR